MRLLEMPCRTPGIALTSCLMGVVSSAYTAFVPNSGYDVHQRPVRRHTAFIEVICSLVGDVLFNSVYSATLYIMTGFVFLVMAAFYAVGSLLIVVFIVKMGRENRTYMKFDDDGVADERGTSLPSLHIE
ncbi:hypothetical protein LSAT2_017149 [Lamellibrachia satsuma]|nr:hypothetical protein LSAT2_017149 [Lamellibrachia satsuma]